MYLLWFLLPSTRLSRSCPAAWLCHTGIYHSVWGSPQSSYMLVPSSLTGRRRTHRGNASIDLHVVRLLPEQAHTRYKSVHLLLYPFSPHLLRQAFQLWVSVFLLDPKRMTCRCFGVSESKWLRLQEPGDAGQAARWRERSRFLLGDSPGGGGRDTCTKGKGSS